MSIRNWSAEQLEYLNKNYEVLPKLEIEQFLGKQWHSIQEFARQRGLKRPQKQFNKRKGSLKPLLEETHEAYYWMGFLMADGYCCEELSQIVVAIEASDVEHLQKYANFIGGKIHLYDNKSGYNVNHKSARISVAESVVCQEILKKFDWKKQKTYNPPSIDILSETLDDDWKFSSFVIGFIDGDGSTSKDSIIKIENHPSWQYILQYIVDRFINMGYNVAETKFSKRGYVSIRLPKTIKLYLQEIPTPKLERKWK